jgi:AbiU2
VKAGTLPPLDGAGGERRRAGPDEGAACLVQAGSKMDRRRYIDRLGEEFGSLYFDLSVKFYDIKLCWQQYRFLFVEDKRRTDLLNECGGAFFYFVERHFFEMTVLSICRLGDKKQTMGRQNLVLEKICDYADPKKEYEHMVQEFQASLSFHRDWRNRRIAHNDLKLIQKIGKPLEIATVAAVEISINLAHKIINRVSIEYFDSSLGFDVVSSPNSELNMLRSLFDGRRYLETKNENKFSFDEYEKMFSYPDWLFRSKI